MNSEVWGFLKEIYVCMCGHAACVLRCFSRVWLFATLWTVALQAPLSKKFSRQEYWSRLPCTPPENLPDWGIKPISLLSLALAGGFFTTRSIWETHMRLYIQLFLHLTKYMYICITSCSFLLQCLWHSF